MSALLIALMLAGEPPKPWEMDWPDEEPYWAATADAGDQYWVNTSEIESKTGPISYTLWLHGNHQHNANVPYRHSLWRLRFHCDGQVVFLASTTTTSVGRSKNWDGYSVSAIRPGTIYKSLERKLCVG